MPAAVERARSPEPTPHCTAAVGRDLRGTRERDAVDMVPGEAAVVAGPDVLYEGAHGVCELGGDQPMTTDTVMSFASMTEAITGLAAMQQVERGALSLDATAADVIPSLSACRASKAAAVASSVAPHPEGTEAPLLPTTSDHRRWRGPTTSRPELSIP